MKFNNDTSGTINQDDFIILLSKLLFILSNQKLSGQAEVVKHLIELLNRDHQKEFIKQINSVDMWGGSGAVWEVNIENKNDARQFEKEMINLIDLMENSKILGKGIAPIRKIFKKNLHSI